MSKKGRVSILQTQEFITQTNIDGCKISYINGEVESVLITKLYKVEGTLFDALEKEKLVSSLWPFMTTQITNENSGTAWTIKVDYRVKKNEFKSFLKKQKGEFLW